MFHDIILFLLLFIIVIIIIIILTCIIIISLRVNYFSTIAHWAIQIELSVA